MVSEVEMRRKFFGDGVYSITYDLVDWVRMLFVGSLRWAQFIHKHWKCVQ